VNSSEGIEADVDEIAREALIPAEVWNKCDTPGLSTEDLLEAGGRGRSGSFWAEAAVRVDTAERQERALDGHPRD
jgi:hypothetical protein